MSVKRQVRNSLWLPTTITWLRKGISFLILFSMDTGWNISPSGVIIRERGDQVRGSKVGRGKWVEIGGRKERKAGEEIKSQ